MKTVLIITSIILILLLMTQIYFIMAKTETQSYQVIKKEKDFEIRKYAPATMATVSMATKSYQELSSTGFRKLASFIFGGNKDQKDIAMTTPVHMDINNVPSSMSFVMPSEYDIENLPKPDNSEIKIERTAEEYVAAIRFGGYADEEGIKKYAAQLENSLKLKGIETVGNFRFLGYNAPYQVLDRRNEMIVQIHWK